MLPTKPSSNAEGNPPLYRHAVLWILIIAATYFLFGQSGTYRYTQYDLLFWAAATAFLTRDDLPRFGNISSFSTTFILVLNYLFPVWVATGIMALFSHLPLDHLPRLSSKENFFTRTFLVLATALVGALFYAINHLSAYYPITAYSAEIFGALVSAPLLYVFQHYFSHKQQGEMPKFPPILKQSNLHISFVFQYLFPASVAPFIYQFYIDPFIDHSAIATATVILAFLYYTYKYMATLARQNQNLENMVHVLVAAMEARDPYTRMHSERVAAIAYDIGKALNLSPYHLEKLTYAAQVHDVGKISVPDKILHKPEKLDQYEFDIVKNHVERGARLIRAMGIPEIEDIIPAVRHHHERWDGTGYPHGLKETDIPLYARIIAIADAYEAMTAGRSYSTHKSPEAALQEILQGAGTQFDPTLTAIFQSLWKQDPIWKHRNTYLSSYKKTIYVTNFDAMLARSLQNYNPNLLQPERAESSAND